MQTVSVWDGFYRSFTDPKAYQGFRLVSSGKAVLHTALVALCITLLIGLPMSFQFSNLISEVTRWTERDVPDFEIRNGKLTVEGTMPIILQDGGQALIIDTTGQTTLETLGPTFKGVLITDSTIYNKKSQFEIQSFHLDLIQSFSKSQLLTWIPYLQWVMPLVTVFMFGFYLLGNLLIALVCAWVYGVSGKGKDKSLTFGETYKIMLFSMTLPRMLIGVFSLLTISIPFYFVITLALTVFFAHRGIRELEVMPPSPAI